jgi:hypothetical protein
MLLVLSSSASDATDVLLLQSCCMLYTIIGSIFDIKYFSCCRLALYYVEVWQCHMLTATHTFSFLSIDGIYARSHFLPP